MSETIGRESQERVKVKETVRGVLLYRGKILLLQKSPESKNPGALEFPGGNIDARERALDALYREVQEETQVNIKRCTVSYVSTHDYFFKVRGTEYRRQVHLYMIVVPDSQEFSVVVGRQKDAMGRSEDKHSAAVWVTPDELRRVAVTLEEGEQGWKRRLSKNSRAIRTLLSQL